ncbi:hypothetical protein CTI12_AA392460 [Artemisia annua]|uniref:DNA helicase Pif1-like 2B domain-containing protein n=1 Tax=Artemisia annua TaxID=35608 RepID=A0A2U1MDL3_ARTAN|nr:hypothetical protein CTI12_AA392460 [Artemisia annua]
MRRQVHSLRLYNAEKNQKHDNSVQAAKGSKKQNKQIELVIIEGDMPAMCPRDRKTKSSTPSNLPMFEADTPTRHAQVGKQPSSIESQHSHENTNIDSSNIQTQDRKNNSSTPSNPSMFEADTSTRHAQEFKGSSLVGKQPSSNEAQHSHENTNINSSNFQTQDINDYEESIIDVSYTRLLENLWNHEVEPPCEEVVDRIDESMMRLIQGDETIYASSYSVSRDGSNTNLGGSIYITNFLNRIRMYNLSQHTIKLKIGSHVMLTQNINRRAGLCNGTMLQVLRLGVNVIEAKIISGENVEKQVHRMEFNKIYYIMQSQRHSARLPTLSEHKNSHTPLEAVELRRINNDAFNLLKERSKSALELEYHLENIESAMSNDMDWLNPEGHKDIYSDSETPSPYGEECNHEYNFDVATEEHQCFPFEDFKDSGITQSRDVLPHPMGRVFLDTSQSPKKLSSDVFPQIKSSSNSIRNEGIVKFLPIRSIDQLRRQIKFNEEENVRDEQIILGDKIHVIVNNGRLTFLEKYFKEDMVVLLRNFSVIPNNTSYKYTKHPYKISYDGVATACRSNTFDADVNKIGFEFTNVIPNNTSYKYTKHPYKISYDGVATACRSNTFDADVNKIGFEFTKFCDIISLNLNTEIHVDCRKSFNINVVCVLDIEGEVFSWGRELRDYEVYGCKTKMLPLKLKDTL